MKKGANVAAVTYYGVDGACAAAVVLTAFPQATVVASSARRIGETLSALALQRWDQVHVCGVGVDGGWDTVAEAAERLRRDGTHLYWHCGRDYLCDDEHRFAQFCSPQFVSAGSNAAAMARYLGVEHETNVRHLLEVARCDRHIVGAANMPYRTSDLAMSVDYIEAAISHYFKYFDPDTYVRAVHTLARNEFGVHDRAMVDVFRHSGYRYLLHGASPATRELKRRILQCAGIDRPVVITGESGVGKEHVAHLLWEASGQAQGPFVPVNCATYAGNSSLANSDLFGHVKGAFTGAVGARRGRFLEADTGILFLDELGELPLEIQAKLLRVVEDGWITPEGADVPQTQVRVRIVAATNRELPKMVRQGAFRADLYHRLATLRIYVPPLRERPDDIPAIVDECLRAFEKEGHSTRKVKNAVHVLQDGSWPGNVRQLLKVVERAVLLELPLEEALREEWESDEVELYGDRSEPPNLLFPTAPEQVRPLKEVQKLYANNVWQIFDRNTTAAARALGVNPNTLRYSLLA